jgi:hypothetical protein
MIISASRRTDIPAFYSDWFMERINKGFVLVRNPMNVHQVSRISLSPSVVDCIVFWTKNPSPLMDKLPALSKYNYYFQFTITPYTRKLEPNVSDKSSLVSIFQKLSRKVNKNRMIWRYDPVILTDEITIENHVASFRKLADSLSGYTSKCVISFLDLYKKSKRNLSGINLVSLTSEKMLELTGKFVSIAHEKNIETVSCAEEIDLSGLGVLPGSCIDDKLISKIAGFPISVNKDKSQRGKCGCVASIDIGAYNTCPHGCLYCYANSDALAVKKNYSNHKTASPLLFGEITESDRITDRKIVSCCLAIGSPLKSAAKDKRE